MVRANEKKRGKNLPELLAIRQSPVDNAEMKKSPKLLSEVVRDAIESCGKTRYRIAQETGISQSALSRFLSGERGLSIEALDVLLPYLGIVVKAPRISPGQKG